MRTSRLTQLLNDYVAGDLDADGRAAVERELASDPTARALLDEVREAHDALCVLRDRPEPPHRAEDALPRIQAAIAAHGFTDRPVLPLEGEGTRYYRRLAMAATLLFAVTAGAFALYSSGGGDTPPVATPETAVEASGEGSKHARLAPAMVADFALRLGQALKPVESMRMYLEDFVITALPSDWAPNGTVMHGTGIYLDEYVKIDGEWLIQQTGYERIFEDFQPRGEGARLRSRWDGGESKG